MLNLTFCFTWMLEETRDIQVRIFSKHLCRNNIEYVLKSHPKNFLYIILCRKRKKFTKLQIKIISKLAHGFYYTTIYINIILSQTLHIGAKKIF